MERNVQIEGRTQNDWRGDDASKHGQKVLETKEECQHHRHLVVKAEKRGDLALPFQEGDVGSEQEGIVIAAAT